MFVRRRRAHIGDKRGKRDEMRWQAPTARAADPPGAAG